MKRVRQRVKELTPRSRCHADLREVVADLNPVVRGWGNSFRMGNAAKKFNQLDTSVWRRLRKLRVARRGRNLKPGEAAEWTRECFWGFGLRCLRGTVRRPRATLLPGGCVMPRHERPPESRVREIRTHGLKGGLDFNRR
jgi:hypothetical protein